MACIGCSAPALPVDVVAHGAVVASAEVCVACLDKCDRELAMLRGQHRRLRVRIRTRGYAAGMMVRRVERYFRDGTLRPLRATGNGR